MEWLANVADEMGYVADPLIRLSGQYGGSDRDILMNLRASSCWVTDCAVDVSNSQLS